MNAFPNLFTRKFLPMGFAQMVMLDRDFQKIVDMHVRSFQSSALS
jgi:hypothetical protein